MARFAVQGVEEYAMKLHKLGSGSQEIAGKAIYAAADIVANQIKSNIEALPTVLEADNVKAYRKGEKSGISKRQKDGLKESFGIASMKLDNNGFYNVKLGFDGYNNVKTRKYPKGQPNQMIARTIESGATYMDKHPFIRPAVNATRKKALEEMQRIIDEATEKVMR